MREYEDILNELYSIFDMESFVSKKAVTLNENTELLADLEIDSLKLMELMLEIEDRFDVSVPLNVLPDVTTIKDLALKIQNLTK